MTKYASRMKTHLLALYSVKVPIGNMWNTLFKIITNQWELPLTRRQVICQKSYAMHSLTLKNLKRYYNNISLLKLTKTQKTNIMTPQEFFKNDLFAENAGVVLLEVREGYSKAKLEIKPEHLNAGARTQGGAIFTLADLALAAAANSHGTLAFSLSSNITFLRASGPGDTLYAEARERYIGRSTGCYQVDVTNQNGDLIATFESSVFRKDQKVPFTL